MVFLGKQSAVLKNNNPLFYKTSYNRDHSRGDLLERAKQAFRGVLFDITNDNHNGDIKTHLKNKFSKEKKFDEKQGICCKYCKTIITRHSARIEMHDRSTHFFVNPAGKGFVVQCFNQAEGCFVHGEPSDFFSWFTGYRWQYAHCHHCGVHLGWYFADSLGNSFFGLITEHLQGL